MGTQAVKTEYYVQAEEKKKSRKKTTKLSREKKTSQKQGSVRPDG
jgi:hypothetical protein